MRIALLFLLMAPMAVGCGPGDEDKPDTGADADADADADTDTDADDTGVTDPGLDPAMVFDFTLEDTNPHSASLGETISPRALIGTTTGWYFIKAT